MLSETMEKALNKQIHAELYSSYLYLAIAAWFHDQNLDGFGSWMEAQAMEEYEHGMKLFHHVLDRGGRVILEAIDKPTERWDSPAAAIKAVADHERHVTGLINDLADLAAREKDHATGVFLHWYISEQVEEEATADRLYHQTAMLDGSPHGLLMLDRELAGRGGGTEDED